MRRRCQQTGVEFEITKEDLEFYSKMNLPLPTLCPEERQRRRITYRNFRTLCYRTCSKTGKRILSMYPEDVPFPVYDHEAWWADDWDASSYGRDFDFSRPFFEQYKELANEVPHFGIMNTNSENCTYSNFTFDSRNCYLVFGCVRTEDCLYGHIVWESERCVDCLYVYQSQWCSNSVDLAGCYDTHYSTECVNCAESYFLHDCRSCVNCFCCTNLRNQKYCIFNQSFSREEYQERIKEYFPLTPQKVREIGAWLEKEKREHCIHPPSFSSQVEEVTGNHLYNSHNLHHCFDAKKTEDSNYCFTVFDVTNCRDISFGSGRFAAEGVALVETEEAFSCHTVCESHNVYYSEMCFSSHDLFGCHGMKRAAHCILNKAYSREDYLVLCDKIIRHMQKTGEWGQFFPVKDSPFAYNESIINEYHPLSKEEAQEQGWRWRDGLENGNNGAAKTSVLPQTIEEAPTDTVEQTFLCEKTKKPYKIINPEFDFYKRIGLPLPHLCPDERHKERMAKRQLRKLWPRKCAKCETTFVSSFSPQDPHQVLCEACYIEALDRGDDRSVIFAAGSKTKSL